MPPKPKEFRISLQSEDHGQLLNVIDGLRLQGISSHIPLPQIIVCGDQSSGKSSVLEAVSGVRFPMKDNLCTRFATELILRRASFENVKVAIIPGPDRTKEEKEHLSGFQATRLQINEFASLVESAKQHMGIDSRTRAFSDDVFRVEVSGPDQPHLTLIDLPGVIHAENKEQTAADVDLVMKLVRGYMESTRSIILAVISAKNDYANQIVTKLAREVDPQRARTLGIITKPDTLDAGSESERKFLDLARNEDVVFRLGWHVLKNRDYDSRECSIDRRNINERAFFAQGVWRSLPRDIVGVDSLKPRLSHVLKDHIMRELPNLTRDIQTGITDCKIKLRRLGGPRDSIVKQSRYLTRVSSSFSSLVSSAVNGTYTDSGDFFGDAMTGPGFQKRLRAVIQDLHLELAEEMHKHGEYEKIVEGTPGNTDDGQSQAISLTHYLANVRQIMRRTRGCELPGTYNPLIIRDLFCRQSQLWDSIVDNFVEKILGAVRKFIELVLDHTMERVSSEGIFRKIIDPCLEDWTVDLKDKIKEILRPYREGHPITYNHYFTETIQKTRQDCFEEQLKAVLRDFHGVVDTNSTEAIARTFRKRTEAHMDNFAAKEALVCMEAYYKVALKDLIDGIANLAVEQCLLRRLPDIFSPEKVADFDEDLIESVAAESESCRQERIEIAKKMDSLENGLRALSQLPYGKRPQNKNVESANGSKKRGRERQDSPEYAPSKPPTPPAESAPSPRARRRRS